ncbi:hypothetical protein G7Y79_00069g096440 [Physcia stellaris]|nr:hypothetical protein G7Y79_00069g096440 [Physcia stellaris]
MASTGVNVLRYSALLVGITYGLYHQSAISTQAKIRQIDREFQSQSNLIAKAKAEYIKKTQPKETVGGGGVISDPDDPKFDLEAFLTMKMADVPK